MSQDDSTTEPAPADEPAVLANEPAVLVELPLRQLVSIARPALGRLLLAVLLGAVATVSAVALLGTSGWLISRSSQRPPESDLALAIAGVQVFALSRAFARYGERLVGHDAALEALAALRVRVYERLERLAPAGLPAFGRADLLARMVHDVDSLQDVVLRVVEPSAVAAVAAVPVVGLLWVLLPGAGAALFAALLLCATVVPWLSRSMARRFEARQADLRGELTASVVDLIEGGDELTAFGANDRQLARISGLDAELTAVARSAARTAGLGSSLTTLLIGLAVVGSLALGIQAVRDHRLAGVVLATVVLVPLAALDLVSGLPVAAQVLQRTRNAGARVWAVMRAPDPVAEAARPLPVPPPPHRLRARGVRGGYPDRGDVLHGVDIDVEAGRRVAVIGPSGAGKSTLALVLLRLLSRTGGTVELDGVDVDDLAGDDLRRVVGMVAQDAHVFDTTVAENLRLARRDATDRDLRDVLRAVGLQAWISELPEGLGTSVGEHGRKLSGGQRQRLAVARALLADFPILVLDEPTEHLDPAAADALEEDLVDLTRRRSTVYVTHRMAALPSMDEVLVLDGGRVVERGTHAELVEADGYYTRLWRRAELTGECARVEAASEPVAWLGSTARESERGPGEH